ncbi:transposase [Pelagicoccus sp. SDUM812002]|uniref:transposase n=1 Tax=Pelagicoccus sp. SDUM812002 TaxID=3041266 RepID=UPI00280DE7BB|nr:transposase [Pelagicoccus sp. SDUM812002]
MVLDKLENEYGWFSTIWADDGYREKPVEYVSEKRIHRSVDLKIFRRNYKIEGFSVLPQRWIVESTFAWLENSCRFSEYYERTTNSSQVMNHIAMTRLMTERLA